MLPGLGNACADPSMIITAVNIPPDVNVNTVLFQLYNIIHKQLQAHPEGAFWGLQQGLSSVCTP